MEIVIKRITKNPYCVGHLYINGKYFCDTLEPPYFGTTQNTPIQKRDTIYNNKVTYRYKYKYLKDTITVNKTDTITKLQKVTEIKVQNQLNVVQKVLIYIGLFSILLFLIILYKYFKK